MGEVYIGTGGDALDGETVAATGVYTSLDACIRSLEEKKAVRDAEIDAYTKEWGDYPYEIFTVTMYKLDSGDPGKTVYQAQGDDVLIDLRPSEG